MVNSLTLPRLKFWLQCATLQHADQCQALFCGLNRWSCIACPISYPMQRSPERTVRFSGMVPPSSMVPGLHAASRDGDAGRVQRMLEDGAPVDEKVSQPKPQP